MTVATTEPEFGQSMLTTTGEMVSANQHLAAEAGARVLAQGGNAVDAAVATAFAVGVVEPAMSGIGGRGYMVIHFTGQATTTVIDGHERAPRMARPDMFVAKGPALVPTLGWGPMVPVEGEANATGHLAVAVPGVVGALALAHQRHGRLPWSVVLEPAIALAEDGFEVSVPLAATLAAHRAKLARFPATAAIFLRDGHAPAAGERLVQADLATTYRLIAQHGPEEFYTGSVARAIEQEMERGGGLLTRRDLAEFEPRVWERPVIGTYRGYRLLTVPEATGGVTLVQAMNLLEGFNLSEWDAFDPRYLHVLVETLRIAFRDRLAVVDDPAFTPVPFAGLASKAFAGQRRQQILLERALADIVPGDAWPFDKDPDSRHPTAITTSWRGSDLDTTHFCVVDSERTVVSMTQSIIDAFGSGVVVPGTGILLNSAMHGFNPIPNQLCSIAPGKRGVHNGTPTIVLREDGRPCLAIGGAGGTKVITGIVQILVNVLDRGWRLQRAVAAPRVHSEGWDSQVDGRIGTEVIERLRTMGHQLEVLQPTYGRPGFSRINGIAIDPAGALSSGVDPFVDAGASATGG